MLTALVILTPLLLAPFGAQQIPHLSLGLGLTVVQTCMAKSRRCLL